MTRVEPVDTFSIVFVCTGNRFRSVLAEAFVHRLTLGLPVTTESYGTLELKAAPALPEAVQLARAYGLDVSRHATRCVQGASLDGADLVIGFDSGHVREAVVKAHAQRSRSFTLRELVRLLDGLTIPESETVVKRARRAVELAAAARADAPSRLPDDMADPLGSPWKAYTETAAEIRDLSLGLVEALFSVTDAAGLPPTPLKAFRRPRIWRR
jgi:low molecular weight protein-tyrosine phosphatase